MGANGAAKVKKWDKALAKAGALLFFPSEGFDNSI